MDDIVVLNIDVARRYSPSVCPDGFITVGRGCYHIEHNYSVTWRTTEDACQTKGSHLVKIKNGDEEGALEHALAQRGNLVMCNDNLVQKAVLH